MTKEKYPNLVELHREAGIESYNRSVLIRMARRSDMVLREAICSLSPYQVRRIMFGASTAPQTPMRKSVRRG